MKTRKEIKRLARARLKKHYFIFVAACLIAALLASEFRSALGFVSAQMPGQTPAQASAQAAGKPVVPGQPVFRTSSATAAPQATAQATQPQGTRAEKATAKGPATYTYTYRMATVRSQQDARSEQERYEAKGFRVSIRKSGNSWALQHTFKGTDEDAAQFLRDVKSAGLGEPMRISRRKN